jgi:hypothetical protein
MFFAEHKTTFRKLRHPAYFRKVVLCATCSDVGSHRRLLNQLFCINDGCVIVADNEACGNNNQLFLQPAPLFAVMNGRDLIIDKTILFIQEQIQTQRFRKTVRYL